MSENALCADPAISGSASAGHGETAAEPARVRRRLTADSFKALTARLRADGDPDPLSESLLAPASFAGDEPIPTGHEAMNGEQTAASAPPEPAPSNGFAVFEADHEDASAGQSDEPLGHDLPPELRTIFADTPAEADEPVDETGAMAAAPVSDFGPELTDMSAGEAVDLSGEAPATDPSDDEATLLEQVKAAVFEADRRVTEARDVARSGPGLPEPVDLPDPVYVGELEATAPATHDESEAETGGYESAGAVQPAGPAEFEPERTGSAPMSPEGDFGAAAFDEDEQDAGDGAGPSETEVLDLDDLQRLVFADDFETAISEADDEPDAASVENEVTGGTEPAAFAAAEPEETTAEAWPTEEETTDVAWSAEDEPGVAALDQDAQAVGEDAGPAGQGVPDLDDLPSPIFADELDAAIPATNDELDLASFDAEPLAPTEPDEPTAFEPEETVAAPQPAEDEPAAAMFDEHGPTAGEGDLPPETVMPDLDDMPGPIADAEDGDAAVDGAGSEAADEPQTLEAVNVADEAHDDGGRGAGHGDDAPGSLQDMLRQLAGQFGALVDDGDHDGHGETARRGAEAAAEPMPSSPKEATADGSRPRHEAAGAGENSGGVEEELAAILGSLSTRLEAGDDRPERADAAAAEPEDAQGSQAPVIPDETSGETARVLLDIMSMPAGSLQPQERSLAADTLLRLIARMPAKSVMSLAERFSLMEEPPGLIIKELIGHPNEDVAALVLERCANVTDQDLLELIANGSENKRLMVARRRHLSSALVDALIAGGEASVFLTIVRNPGADVSYDAFIELCEVAKNQPSLQAPLATRVNTPAPVAFELFWFLPSELRRYVLSRFLTDSETLSKILKITLAVDASAANDVTERKFPPRARIEELVGLIEEGLTPEASRLMASLSGICEACARRLIADPGGEPLTIVMKAMGATRALFAAAVERWQTSTSAMLRTDRNLDELRNLFDSMSFNKARVLLTYWDWAARKAGPYARRAA